MSQTIFPNLVTNDIESTVAWYQHNLGAAVKLTVPSKQQPDKAIFATIVVAGSDIMLQTVENIEEKYPTLKGKVQMGYGVALNIQVPDAQVVYDHLTDTARVIAEPADMFYHMREFTIEDPNGYILTVASMLSR